MFALFADTKIVATSSIYWLLEKEMYDYENYDEWRSYKSNMYVAPKYTIVPVDVEPHTLPCYHAAHHCPFDKFRLIVGGDEIARRESYQSRQFSDDEIPF